MKNYFAVIRDKKTNDHTAWLVYDQDEEGSTIPSGVKVKPKDRVKVQEGIGGRHDRIFEALRADDGVMDQSLYKTFLEDIFEEGIRYGMSLSG